MTIIDKNLTITDALTWGNFRGHCQKSAQGSLGSRIVHVIIAAIEFLPIISQIASLMEFFICSCLPAEQNSNSNLSKKVAYFPQPALMSSEKNDEPELYEPSENISKQQTPHQSAPEAPLKPPDLKQPIEKTNTEKEPEQSTIQPPPENKAHPFIKLLVDNPRALLENENFLKEFPNLKECQCPHVSPKLRLILEKITLEATLQTFTNKNECFTLVSIGAGQCFQELAYLNLLSKAGYKNVKLIVIDPSKETKDSIQDLEKFSKQHLVNESNQIHIQHYETLESYQKEAATKSDLKPKLLCFIDISGEKDPNRPIQNLLNHSFGFFKTHSLINEGSLIAFTRTELSHTFCYCKSYQSQAQNLFMLPSAITKVDK
jgi:hypothetical protein